MKKIEPRHIHGTLRPIELAVSEIQKAIVDMRRRRQVSAFLVKHGTLVLDFETMAYFDARLN